jgi:hypothetical protein
VAYDVPLVAVLYCTELYKDVMTSGCREADVGSFDTTVA